MLTAAESLMIDDDAGRLLSETGPALKAVVQSVGFAIALCKRNRRVETLFIPYAPVHMFIESRGSCMHTRSNYITCMLRGAVTPTQAKTSIEAIPRSFGLQCWTNSLWGRRQ
jgi:hypothetical protein